MLENGEKDFEDNLRSLDDNDNSSNSDARSHGKWTREEREAILLKFPEASRRVNSSQISSEFFRKPVDVADESTKKFKLPKVFYDSKKSEKSGDLNVLMRSVMNFAAQENESHARVDKNDCNSYFGNPTDLSAQIRALQKKRGEIYSTQILQSKGRKKIKPKRITLKKRINLHAAENGISVQNLNEDPIRLFQPAVGIEMTSEKDSPPPLNVVFDEDNLILLNGDTGSVKSNMPLIETHKQDPGVNTWYPSPPSRPRPSTAGTTYNRNNQYSNSRRSSIVSFNGTMSPIALSIVGDYNASNNNNNNIYNEDESKFDMLDQENDDDDDDESLLNPLSVLDSEASREVKVQVALALKDAAGAASYYRRARQV